MRANSRQVPSAYFIADAVLYLDLLLSKRLLRPTQTDDRVALAGQEGVKGKRLIGALRTLWRSNVDGGHDPRIRDLKSYLQASPARRRVTWFIVSTFPHLFLDTATGFLWAIEYLEQSRTYMHIAFVPVMRVATPMTLMMMMVAMMLLRAIMIQKQQQQ